MDFQLTEEVAVIIGGARGIGRAVAEEFAQHQAMVAIVDISPAAEQTAREIADQYKMENAKLRVQVAEHARLIRNLDAQIKELERDVAPTTTAVSCAQDDSIWRVPQYVMPNAAQLKEERELRQQLTEARVAK